MLFGGLKELGTEVRFYYGQAMALQYNRAQEKNLVDLKALLIASHRLI